MTKSFSSSFFSSLFRMLFCVIPKRFFCHSDCSFLLSRTHSFVILNLFFCHSERSEESIHSQKKDASVVYPVKRGRHDKIISMIKSCSSSFFSSLFRMFFCHSEPILLSFRTKRGIYPFTKEMLSSSA